MATQSAHSDEMSALSNQADTLLLALVKHFAFQDDEGNWWGMDTNLGKCEDAFAKAKQAILEVRDGRNV